MNINVNYGIQIYQYWLNCNKYTTLMQKITKGRTVCMGAEHTGTLYSFFCKLNCPKKLVFFFLNYNYLTNLQLCTFITKVEKC